MNENYETCNIDPNWFFDGTVNYEKYANSNKINVYFENSHSETRVIDHVDTYDEVGIVIHRYIDYCNKKRKKDFKIYYMRMWYIADKNKTKIDVGSHSEFFYVDGNMLEHLERNGG